MAEGESMSSSRSAELGVARPGQTLGEDLAERSARARLRQSLFGTDESVPQIGRFVFLRRLGAGGMGVVCAAYDPQLRREVAVKILRGGGDERSNRRVLREAQALAKLSHPNVIHVYEVGSLDDGLFIAMELVEGGTLTEWLERRKRSWREILAMMVQAGRGLAAAHAAGLVHRDFKPANCLVDDDGRVRVLDFGLARDVDRPGSDALAGAAASVATTIEGVNETQTGPPTHTRGVVGTVLYMPPEQWAGESPDARSDQFSFAVTLFEALFGRHPFAPTFASMASFDPGSIEGPPEYPADSPVPGWVRTVLTAALAPRPQDRYPSIEVMLDHLGRDPGPRRRRVLAATGVVAFGGAAASIGYFGAQSEDTQQCASVDDELAGVWDDARREAIAAAFAASQVPYADAAWSGVRDAVDRHVQGWGAMHEATCAAASPSHQDAVRLLDLRKSCLSLRLAELRVLTDVLADADVKLVQRSQRVVGSLKTLDRCVDEEALMARGTLLPSDPAERDRAAAIEAQLAKIQTLLSAGRYPGALELAHEVHAEAEELGHAPTTAAALVELGHSEIELSDLDGGREHLGQAYRVAHAAGNDAAAGAAGVLLVELVGSRQSRVDEGLVWATIAEAALDRAGADETQYIKLWESKGAVLFQNGDFAGAQKLFERAVESAEAVHGADDPIVASALTALSASLSEQGQVRQSLEHDARALAIARPKLGDAHPFVGSLTVNQANNLSRSGDHAAAIVLYREALTIFERALGPDHGHVAKLYVPLGLVLTKLERFDEAIAALETAVERCTAAFGGEHPLVADALHNLGVARVRAGQPEQARAHFERAVAILEAAFGPEHAKVARTRKRLDGLAGR